MTKSCDQEPARTARDLSKSRLHERSERWRFGFVAGLLFAGTALGCDPNQELLDSGVSPAEPGPVGAMVGTAGGPGGAATGGGASPGATAPAFPGGGVTGGGLPSGSIMDGGMTGAGGDSAWCHAKAVLDQRCVACHNGTSTGPMTLLSAADFHKPAAVSAGKTVAQAVSARIHDTAKPMPPEGNLSAAELATLDAFIAAGSPAGDGSLCSAPPTGNTGGAAVWPPAGCDALVKILSRGPDNGPYVVKPGQEDHPEITVDAPWGNETVQAIAFRPITDNLKVLHHWILYAKPSANNGVEAFLVGWAPGDDGFAIPYPSDVGMEMPKGAGSMQLDMHYYGTNETVAQNDQSGVEICIVKGAKLRPKPAAVTMEFNSNDFFVPMAPANTIDHESTATCEVITDAPVTLIASGPHAHKLGTRTKFWIKKKNGGEIVLHDGPFNFDEQRSYPLTPGIAIETGDTVYTSCFFTNKSSRDVSFGQSTEDEMCYNLAAYYPKTANLRCGLGGLLGGLFE